MWELVVAGGIMMAPILLCSLLALAIAGERLWTLRRSKVLPRHLVAQVWNLHKKGQLDVARIHEIRSGSPLGRILATGLVNMRASREVMKESIEEAGRQVVHELERFLSTLSTIASVSPLLGLLGTVLGMIKVFTAISTQGVGKPGVLAGGISEALITTAAGLIVAIPALLAYRWFRGRVDEYVVRMEEEALKLVEVIHGQRERQTLDEA